MDLPAPVSPVRTLRPSAKGTVTSSMTARFLIRSSRSTSLRCYARGGSGLKRIALETGGSALLPAELGAEDGEEVLVGDVEEADARGGLADLDGVGAHELEAHLPVHGQHHVLVGA